MTQRKRPSVRSWTKDEPNLQDSSSIAPARFLHKGVCSSRRYQLEDFGEVEKPAAESLGDIAAGNNRISRLSLSLRKRLATVGGGKKNDPSNVDFGVFTTMLEEGLSPEDALATFAASPRGTDARERKDGHFDDYLQRTITKAVCQVKSKKAAENKLWEEIEPETGQCGDEDTDDPGFFEEANRLPSSDRWGIESGKDTIAGADETPDWAIEGILTRDGGLLCSGLPHATKSLIWLCAALQCVTTRRVWGKFAVPKAVRNVVFVETEDSGGLVKRRLRSLCNGMGIPYPPSGFHLVRPGPFSLVEDGQEKLRDVIRKTHADLMIVSTLQGLINGADWKEQRDMAPINAVFVSLMSECAIVLITHSPWNEKRAAGSVTQAANFSSLMHVEKKITDEATIAAVTLDSKEIDRESQFNLRLNIQPHDYGNGRVTTQVRSVEWNEKRGRPSTAAGLREQAMMLKRGGKSVRQIADELELSKSAVQRMFL